VKIKTHYTYCEQVGRRGKDYENDVTAKVPITKPAQRHNKTQSKHKYAEPNTKQVKQNQRRRKSNIQGVLRQEPYTLKNTDKLI
jgi:hypothetical protein